MAARFPAPPLSADDLLVLLAVSRTGRFTTAGQRLGLNHTTVARRIAALEAQLGGRVLMRAGAGWELTPLGSRALAAAEDVEAALGGLDERDEARVEGLIRLSATDGFSGFVAAPAMTALRARHPGVVLEIVTGTRQASQQRAGADLEVVVGRPQVRRARALHLARLLPERIDERLPYWLVARAEALRQPAVAAFLEALQERLAEVRGALLGER